ncbi:MAG TPA: hypothetical protein GXX19_08905 [Syntrophomonadaceae bacterium]|nr:hypothetical protein [Syntrophomonadaceae bacterium]
MSYADALANAARKSMETALKTQEASDWNAIMKSAYARGIGNSPLAAYEQRKVAEAYAPQYTQAAAEAARLGAELGWEEEKLNRQLAAQAAERAARMQELQKQLEAEDKWKWQQLQWEKEQFGKQLGWEQEKFGKQLSWEQQQLAQQLAAQRALQERQEALERWKELLPWSYGLTPAQKLEAQIRMAQNAIDMLRAAETSNNSISNVPRLTQNQWEGGLTQLADYYKSPADYLADLIRYKGNIISTAGAAAYNRLLQAAQEEADLNPYKRGSKFVPGGSSPMRQFFSQLSAG